ncbi:MAG TPA: SGNH/GDSL hydrolase family protein [Candidatus Saccharimonadales bacterium]|nr:SGNH/GDSL hydrolase family protein [Candidatus Saccharimonadales bacterium]
MNTNPAAQTILCYGDSNTWGQKPDKAGRYPVDVRWTGLLQKALGQGYYVIEEGLGSRTTDLEYARKPGRNGKTYLEPCLDSHLPIDIVILMLGTNDLKIEFNRSVQDIASAIERLIEIIKDKTAYQDNKAAQIILVSPILIDNTAPNFAKLYTPDYYDHESALKSRQLAPALQKVAGDAGCLFVDAAQVAHAGDDGIHFSQEAHTALGRTLTTLL